MSRILVVDDDATTVELVHSVLEVSGYACLTAASGAEALEILRSAPGILLVISDINMPGMNGISLLERVNALQTRQPPRVIFITAYPSVDYAVAALRLGAIDFLTKPVRPQNILEVVRGAMARVEREHTASNLPEETATLAQQAETLAAKLKALVQRQSGAVQEPSEPSTPERVEPAPKSANASHMGLLGLDYLLRLRRAYPPLGELDDVAWDLLRALLRAEQDSQRLSVSALSVSVEEASVTTALRRIQELTRAGHIIRSPDPLDARRDFVTLAPDIRRTLEEYLERVAQELASVAGST